MQRLESRLSGEVARVEREAQEANQAVVAELNKWKKEREICWKHVAELKVRLGSGTTDLMPCGQPTTRKQTPCKHIPPQQ